MTALFESAADVQTIVDPKDAAESAGLRYVSDARPGIRRRKSGKGFTYTRADGSGLQSPTSSGGSSRSPSHRPGLMSGSARLRTGTSRPPVGMPRDASNTATIRGSARCARAPSTNTWSRLPRRCRPSAQKSASTWRSAGLPREKVLATVVHLLETTLIRVGNDDYAKQNNSYGLTTLKTRHVAVDGNEVRFRFTGKSGKQWSLRVRDRRIAKIIRACQELPGQELLQYLDEDGKPQDVTSSDVNAYLKEITGRTSPRRTFGLGLARCWPPWR